MARRAHGGPHLAEAGGRAVKSLDAQDVRLLKQVIRLELDAVRADSGVDVALLMGADGRIFAASMPTALRAREFALMERMKAQVPALATALRRQRMQLQVQSYEEGSVVVAEVGRGSFLVALKADGSFLGAMDAVLGRLSVACRVLDHLIKEKGLSPEETRAEPEPVRKELEALSYRLFREAYDTTKTARKNREVAEFLRKRIRDRLGAGLVDEVMGLTYNELGSSERFMNDLLWQRFIETVVEKHVRRVSGDIVADVCARTWSRDVRRMVESFV
ncbi:MAG TPA: hypothetical protein VGB42_04400 [Candidatus Thermoplasmatota archaeon]